MLYYGFPQDELTQSAIELLRKNEWQQARDVIDSGRKTWWSLCITALSYYRQYLQTMSRWNHLIPALTLVDEAYEQDKEQLPILQLRLQLQLLTQNFEDAYYMIQKLSSIYSKEKHQSQFENESQVDEWVYTYINYQNAQNAYKTQKKKQPQTLRQLRFTEIGISKEIWFEYWKNQYQLAFKARNGGQYEQAAKIYERIYCYNPNENILVHDMVKMFVDGKYQDEQKVQILLEQGEQTKNMIKYCKGLYFQKIQDKDNAVQNLAEVASSSVIKSQQYQIIITIVYFDQNIPVRIDELYYRLAHAYLLKLKYELCIEWANKSISLGIELANCYYLIGKCYLNKQKKIEGEKSLKQCIAIDANHELGISTLFNFYKSQNKVNEARQLKEDLIGSSYSYEAIELINKYSAWV